MLDSVRKISTIERAIRRYIAVVITIAAALFVGASWPASAEQSTTVVQPPLPGTNPEVMRFIDRATSTGQGFDGRLYFAKLPDDLPTEVPLPLGTSLLGSIERTNTFGESFWLFYDIKETNVVHAVDAYETRLLDAGWSEQRRLGRPTTGFVDDYGKTFCATGRPSITVSRLTSGDGGNLNITIQRTTAVGQCGNVVDLAAQPPNPVPRLTAPSGTDMTIAFAQRSTETGAILFGSVPLSALVDAFEAQLLAAKWRMVDKTVGKRGAIETFTFTDASGARWDAVLTLYASIDKANTYYAGIAAHIRDPAAQ